MPQHISRSSGEFIGGSDMQRGPFGVLDMQEASVRRTISLTRARGAKLRLSPRLIGRRSTAALLVTALVSAMVAVGGCGILGLGSPSWTTVRSPTHAYLASVAMVSASEGWAVGADGVILHYHTGP